MAKRSAEDADWEDDSGKRKRMHTIPRTKAKRTHKKATPTRPKRSKSTKKSRKQSPEKPCMFLQLPRELRDEVYSSIATDSTAAIDKRGGGTISCSEALSLVNKQIRSEFLSALYLDAGSLVAKVVDFNFSHIITFFNRLSERENRNLIGGPQSSEARKLKINLFVTRTCDPEPQNTGLKRWICRFSQPTKRGTHVECTYTNVVDKEFRKWESSEGWQSCGEWQEQWYDFRSLVGGVIAKELGKVMQAVESAADGLSSGPTDDEE